MTGTSDREYSIDISGVAEEQQALARQSMRQAIEIVAAIAEKQGSQFLLEGICLTDRFEDEVNRLLQKRSGEAGYRARRTNVQAIGKTVWVRSKLGDIRFMVVVDALAIEPCRLDNARCLATVLHELGHVLRNESHLRIVGEESFISIEETRERCLSDWAKTIVDEFDVDRLVNSLLGALATTTQGNPLSLRYLEEAEGVDWVRTLLDGLSALPKSVDDMVWKYQIRQIGIEELASAVIPKVREVLTILSHTTSIYMDTEHWPDIANEIAETEASKRFFKEYLDAILGQLDIHDSSLEDRIAVVSQAVEGIFSNCGLRFETVPEGVYIAVSAPAA